MTEDITPPGSVAPVFIDNTPLEPVADALPVPTGDEALIAIIKIKIDAGIPLTEEEIALIGSAP